MQGLKRAATGAYVAIERPIERLIDMWYGLPREASRMIPLEDLGLDENDRQSYEPSPWGTLRRILPRNEVSTEDVFLDLGAGMGRVLLEAARYPFKRIVGVELSAEFAQVARDAVERNARRLRCGDIELVAGDVADYEIPDDVTVVYLYDSFRGATFESLIDRLVASVDRNPRRMRFIYLDPHDEGYLAAAQRIRLLRYGRKAVRRWGRADYLRLYEILPSTG